MIFTLGFLATYEQTLERTKALEYKNAKYLNFSRDKENANLSAPTIVSRSQTIYAPAAYRCPDYKRRL